MYLLVRKVSVQVGPANSLRPHGAPEDRRKAAPTAAGDRTATRNPAAAATSQLCSRNVHLRGKQAYGAVRPLGPVFFANFSKLGGI